MNRRKFLRQGAAIVAAGLSTKAAAEPRPQAPRNLRMSLSKRVIERSDLNYLGFYKVPSRIYRPKSNWLAGVETNAAHGLTGRWQADIFSLIIPGNYVNPCDGVMYAVMEFPVNTKRDSNPPTPVGSENLMSTQDPPFIFRGDVHGEYMAGSILGIYWDPVDERLYYNCAIGYGGDTANVGYGKLSAPGASTPKGWWKLTSSKWCGTGMVPIPQWYADAYLGRRKRLACGFGGSYSMSGAGGTSYGPVLVAVDPAAFTSTAIGQSIPSSARQTLMAYAYHPGSRPAHPLRSQRPGPIEERVGWDKDGVRYWWDATGIMRQNTVWIDTDTKHGVLAICPLCYGEGETTIAEVLTPNPGDPADFDDTRTTPEGDCWVRLADPKPVASWLVPGFGLVYGSESYRWGGQGGRDFAIIKGADGDHVNLGAITANRWPVLGGEFTMGSLYHFSRGSGTACAPTALVYDPMDYLAVINDGVNAASEAELSSPAALADDVVYRASWRWEFPHQKPVRDGYLGGWTEQLESLAPLGAHFDPVLQRLYLLCHGVYDGGNHWPSPGVLVYRVV